MSAGDAAPHIVPFGDSALLVSYGDRIDVDLNARVHRLAAAVREAGRPWAEPVPAYASLLVPFDPLGIPGDAAVRALGDLVTSVAGEDDREPPARVGPADVVLDVRYGGADGPDLDEVAERTGLSPSDVVALHTGRDYQVFMLGFVPGFAYLGPLPPALALPRRPEPRTRVPAGSVAIAESQTGVYPAVTPGGWHLIGRTDAVLWDVRRSPPALLAPGQRVAFRSVAG